MSGPGVSGGGTIAVDTEGMVRAADRLAASREALDRLVGRTASCVAGLPASPGRRYAEEALVLLHRASRQAETAGDGLRIAASRYGVVEHAALEGQRGIAALLAAMTGGLMRVSLVPFGLLGPVIVAGGVLEVGGALVLIRTVHRTIETGRFAPQADPVLLRALALVLSSLDDGARGAMLRERTSDLFTDDPAAPFGREQVAALLAGMLLRPPGGPLSVTPTTRRPVGAPRNLVDLVDRLPDPTARPGQIRIERYGDGVGTRWIVYIAGTATFSPDSGDEPFDLASDVLGVAHRTSDSERAVLQAMEEAGVGADEPVLLVGHSQGALNAVRVAQDGGYRVGGVVQFGGPTGQITLPPDVPVLAVEHDEDLVPALGGTAATGAAGLSRLVVRRSLPDGGFGPVTSAATTHFPAHDLGAYRRTIALAEASGDDRVAAFAGRIGPFLSGDRGTSTRWRARRVSPGPAPTAAAAPAPPPSR